ncbi:MAG: hypothetical protein AABX29_05180 [Nanoarchaeota archaeon]
MEKRNFIPIALTFLVITGLIIAGNASAFSIDIKPDKERATAGEIVNFHITITGENISGINDLVLNISGPEARNCQFNTDGTPLADCDGIEIKKLGQSEKFGYGYSENQFIKYKISLETKNFDSGEYNIELTANSDSGSSSKTTGITLRDKKKK